MRHIVLIGVLFFSLTLFSSEIIPTFEKPKLSDFWTNIPSTAKGMWNESFSKDAIPGWIAVGLSSAVLIYYDQEILDEVQKWGRDLGLGNSDHTRNMISIGDFVIFRGPTELGSWMYFIGDGWTHFGIATGFLISGAIRSNNRALQTGSQIFHGLMMSTIPNQIFKRSFGRESPYRSSRPGGAWRPFPSFETYNDQISKYDAMPSGHIMTATMTFTVIDENYPEYRYFMRPISLGLITLLGLQMVNNAVHWAGDYPLGIAMGYITGKVVSRIGRTSPSDIANNSSLNIYPILSTSNQDQVYGGQLIYNF